MQRRLRRRAGPRAVRQEHARRRRRDRRRAARGGGRRIGHAADARAFRDLPAAAGARRARRADQGRPRRRATRSNWCALEVRELVAGSFLDGAPDRRRCRRGPARGSTRCAAPRDDRRAPRRAAREDGPARLPIDRVFSMKGFGTVVTGTLVSGRLDVDEPTTVVPGGPAREGARPAGARRARPARRGRAARGRESRRRRRRPTSRAGRPLVRRARSRRRAWSTCALEVLPRRSRCGTARACGSTRAPARCSAASPCRRSCGRGRRRMETAWRPRLRPGGRPTCACGSSAGGRDARRPLHPARVFAVRHHRRRRRARSAAAARRHPHRRRAGAVRGTRSRRAADRCAGGRARPRVLPPLEGGRAGLPRACAAGATRPAAPAARGPSSGWWRGANWSAIGAALLAPAHLRHRQAASRAGGGHHRDHPHGGRHAARGGARPGVRARRCRASSSASSRIWCGSGALTATRPARRSPAARGGCGRPRGARPATPWRTLSRRPGCSRPIRRRWRSRVGMPWRRSRARGLARPAESRSCGVDTLVFHEAALAG